MENCLPQQEPHGVGRPPRRKSVDERPIQALGAASDMALLSGLYRASGAIRQHLERTLQAEVGLHWSAFAALLCLWRNGQVETRRLADETGVAKSTLSSILNMLEERKLVRRRAHDRERRLVLVDLTAAGVELISALFPKVRAEEARIVAHLPSVQRKATADTIRVILATIAQLEALDEP